MTKFSVIIPLYNKALYVTQSILSVWDQTYKDYELIIIDDGSTDNSANIVKELLEKNNSKSNVLIQQNNLGVSQTRNNGVSISKGEYICFLDADDWWEPTFLEDMANFIDCYPDAGIYGTAYYYVKYAKKRLGVHIKTGYINYFKEYAKKLEMPLTSISVSIPRKVFLSSGGFHTNLKLGEDFNLWSRIAMHYKVAFLNKPLANYNQDVDNANRGTGKLHNPENHMLWHIEEFSGIDALRDDYYLLVDRLRILNLMPYYLSPLYSQIAKKELDKVNWKKQPIIEQIQYKFPITFLRFKRFILTKASLYKKNIQSFFRK